MPLLPSPVRLALTVLLFALALLPLFACAPDGAPAPPPPVPPPVLPPDVPAIAGELLDAGGADETRRPVSDGDMELRFSDLPRSERQPRPKGRGAARAGGGGEIAEPDRPRSSPAAPDPRPAPGPVPAVGLLPAINRARTAGGLPELLNDGRLSEIAAARARDMAEGGYFGHDSPNGTDLRALLSAYDVQFARAGENLARAAGTSSDLASTIAEGFMRSPAHREVLLHPAMRRVGIAAHRGRDGQAIYVVVFTD